MRVHGEGKVNMRVHKSGKTCAAQCCAATPAKLVHADAHAFRAPPDQPPVVSPPITCSTVPVMYDESAFEARNT